MRKQIEVKRGFLSATGRTKTEAQAKLNVQIDWALECASSMVESRFGLLLILGSSANGYAWQVIDPSELSNSHGKQLYGTCFVGQIAYSDALNRMRVAAAQRAWSVFVPDDDVFIAMANILPASQGDLRSWIAFQRSYRLARENGASDVQAHKEAMSTRA